MTRHFELFVAWRYLLAKRKQAVISVITLISVIGVAAGVMALVIALAINTGFRNTLQRNLLGATAHVSVLEKEPGYGISGWRELLPRLKKLPSVRDSSPSLYASVFLTSPIQPSGAVLKGVPIENARRLEPLRKLKEGSLDDLEESRGFPGIVLGARLAHSTGMKLNSVVTVISPQSELTPFGPRLRYFRFRVTGIFESGFYDLDSAWAFTTLKAAQRVLAVGDVVNSIELKLDDIQRAPEVAREAEKLAGGKFTATHWMEQNRQVLGALRMEKVVTVITIGLIQLVAALNILISLVMMVMEKHRDIAILISMGARREQIGRIFMLQGMLIGVAGTLIGLLLGYALSTMAGHYRWIRLDEAIYSLSFVPFEPRWVDGVWVAGVALAVSFLATIYPARNATRIAPAEALRYE